MRVLIDGIPAEPSEASISVFDWGLQRGEGLFEVVRSIDGRVFALDAHLDRLEAGAARLELDLPPRSDMAGWIKAVAADGGNCMVRLVMTRGGVLADIDAPGRCIVAWEPLPEEVDGFRILPVAAPWHSAGVDWDLTGVKVISYAPNMSATRRARREGFHDAVLISRDGWVLEGPTWSIAWFVDGVLETPAMDLGILASVTRAEVLKTAADIGLMVVEGRWTLDRLDVASEVVALSTLKDVAPVIAVGSREFSPGEETRKLAEAFAARVAASPSL
jgi:branched-subunit amino acid aminotransferase/4-amino-4-deoxychorismate lyase